MFARISPRAGMLLVVLFWAGNFTASKIAFTELDPLAFTALRFTIASVVLWGVVRWVQGPTVLPKGVLVRLIWLGVFGNTIYQLLFMEGLKRTSATKTSLILAGMPALVTLAAGVLRVEKVTAGQRVAVLVATVGVVVVILGRGGSIDSGFGTGELMLLGAVAMWAVFTLLQQHWAPAISPLTLTAWTVYTGTPGLVIAGMPALLHTHWHQVTFAGWGGLAYSALLSLVVAYLFWNRGLTQLGAARTVVYNTMVPLVATIIAMIALHERPGLIHIVGGIFILAGVFLTKHAVAAEG